MRLLVGVDLVLQILQLLLQRLNLLLTLLLQHLNLSLQLIDLRCDRWCGTALRRARCCGDGSDADERRVSKGPAKRHHAKRHHGFPPIWRRAGKPVALAHLAAKDA